MDILILKQFPDHFQNLIFEKISQVHLLGIRSKTQLTKEVIQAGSRLLGIGAFCIGTNQIDMNAAIENGIAVFNSPFSNTRSVAELVIAHCINLMRRVVEKNEVAHRGEWLKEASGSFEIRGKTLGIIGYGHIGSQVSVLAENMGMKVILWRWTKIIIGNASSVKSLEELLKRSDIVTLHVPGLSTTKTWSMSNVSRKWKTEPVWSITVAVMLWIFLPWKKRSPPNASAVCSWCISFRTKKQYRTFYHTLARIEKCDSHSAHRRIYSGSSGKYWYWCSGKLINFLETGSTTGSLSVPLWVYRSVWCTPVIAHSQNVLVFLVKSMENYPIWTWTFWDNTSKQIIRLVTLFSMWIKTSAKAMEELKSETHYPRKRIILKQDLISWVEWKLKSEKVHVKICLLSSPWYMNWLILKKRRMQ